MLKRISTEAVLDQIVNDRLTRYGQTASYRLPDVRSLRLGEPQSNAGFYESPGPSVWINGRYLGELAGESAAEVALLAQLLPADGELAVTGRFRHLGFEIDRLEAW